jgi:hypothetical protein
MRLNRGTIVLLLASLAVIIAVLLLSNNQASAPDTSLTPIASTAETVGALFPGLEYASVDSIEIVNNQNGEKTVLAKRATGDWLVEEATYATDREVDQPATTGFVQRLVGLQINDSFASEKLSDFGLTTPAYVVTMNLDTGTVYKLYIGNKNPTGNRYYATLETIEGTAPAAEATEEPTDEAAVEAAQDSTVEVTTKATAEVTAEMDAEATDEATSEVTDEAIAEATIEATAEPYDGVTLGESGTVYVVSLNALDEVINQIAAPPYVPAPTATATATSTLNPMSEVEQATATAQANGTVTAIFEEIAGTATAAASTPEVTTEATAEATEE